MAAPGANFLIAAADGTLVLVVARHEEVERGVFFAGLLKRGDGAIPGGDCRPAHPISCSSG